MSETLEQTVEREGLPPLEILWLDDAKAVLAAPPATLARLQAERLYVLTTLAKVQAEAGLPPEHLKDQADEVNRLYNLGLLSVAPDGYQPPRMERSAMDWLRYVRNEIQAKVRLGKSAPRSYAELTIDIHFGRSWFED